MTLQSFAVRTSERNQLVDITAQVQRCVEESGVQDGIACVFAPHTTAGVTINENADPDVVHDVLAALTRAVPAGAGYRHIEGNSDSHAKSSIVGASVMVIMEKGRLQLGTWQAIYFAEFDGPRNRECWVKVVG